MNHLPSLHPTLCGTCPFTVRGLVLSDLRLVHLPCRLRPANVPAHRWSPLNTVPGSTYDTSRGDRDRAPSVSFPIGEAAA
jgi:hypothetical protein